MGLSLIQPRVCTLIEFLDCFDECEVIIGQSEHLHDKGIAYIHLYELG